MPAALTIGPPLLDLGFLKYAESLRCLLFAGWNFKAKIGEPLAYARICERIHDRAVKS